MPRTLFTSDTHFGHANIILLSGRPFARDLNGTLGVFKAGFPDIELHDETLIRNWNEVVGPDDEVWHLGDIFMGKKDPNFYFDRLNGHIHLITGNHDKKALSIRGRFASVDRVAEITVTEAGKKHDLFLSHYAHRVWNRSHHGVWHLYGHSHGSLPDDPNSLSLDIGVDCWNFTPVSIGQIKARMALKTWKPVDHHADRNVPTPR
jgi:calcineurin-like phosphoesterase family protein